MSDLAKLILLKSTLFKKGQVLQGILIMKLTMVFFIKWTQNLQWQSKFEFEIFNEKWWDTLKPHFSGSTWVLKIIENITWLMSFLLGDSVREYISIQCHFTHFNEKTWFALLIMIIIDIQGRGKYFFHIFYNRIYTWSLGTNIFFTIFEEEFIYLKILPSPPLSLDI